MGKKQRVRKSDDSKDATVRLTDIDTHEVSVVDRAANGRKFSVIKADGSIEAGNIENPIGLAADVDAVRCQIAVVKSQIEDCAEGDGYLGGQPLTSLIASHLILKAMSGKDIMVPMVIQKDQGGELALSPAIKSALVKDLTEIDRRLSSLAKATVGAETFSPKEAETIESLADYVAKCIVVGSDSQGFVSLEGADAKDLQIAMESVEKSINDLTKLYICLGTNGSDFVKKSDASLVDSLVSISDAIDRNVVKMSSQPAGVKGSFLQLIKKFNDYEVGENDSVKKFSDEAQKVLKKQFMFRTRYNNDKVAVVRDSSPEVVKEFDTWEEAEMVAFKMNIMAVLSSMRGEDSMEEGEEMVDMISKTSQTEEVDNVSPEQKACQDEEKKSKGNETKKEGSEETTKDEGADDAEKTEEVTEDVAESEDNEVSKSKLETLKSSVGKLKTGLAEVLSGGEDVTKIAEASSEISELRKSAMRERGIVDNRGLTPDRPNAGCGVQPDTSVIGNSDDVRGLGTPASLDEVLKRLNEVEQTQESEIKKRDSEIKRLELELEASKSIRVAPSSPFMDDEYGSVTKSKSTKEENVAWPRDMTSLPEKSN